MNIQRRDHHDRKNAHDHLPYVCASKSKIVTKITTDFGGKLSIMDAFVDSIAGLIRRLFRWELKHSSYLP